MSWLDIRGKRFYISADRSREVEKLYGVKRIGHNKFLVSETHGNAAKLQAMGLRMSWAARDLVEQLIEEYEARKTYIRVKFTRIQQLLKRPLGRLPLKTVPFRHQKKAIAVGAVLRSLALFMDPGTGKTLTAIAITGLKFWQSKVKRVLIVCPLSVVDVWGDQLAEHADFDHQFKTVTKNDPEFPEDGDGCNIVAINYDFYWRKRIKKLLLRWNPDMVILDESHRAKSRKATSAKFARRLGDRVEHKLALSGTPMEKPTDIWSQLRFLDIRMLPERYAEFEEEYVVKGGYMGLQTIGYQNQDRLNRIISSTAYRVTLDEAVDLPQWNPSKRYCYLPLKLRKAYNQLDANMETELLGPRLDTTHVLTKLTKMHQMCGGFVKMPDGSTLLAGDHKLRLAEEVFDEYADEKLVVFCKYLAELDALKQIVEKSKRKCFMIVGKTKDKTAQRKAFQSSSGPDIMLAQFKAGGIGIDLFTSRVVVNYSLPQSWTEAFQAWQRVRRIGQTGDRLSLIHLLVRASVDEDILTANLAKEDLVKYLLRRRKQNG